MKALPFIIPKTEETFMVQVDRQPYFYDILHRHPEIQLTLILSGEGTVITGDYLGDFKPGDIFLIGHNMPHVFRSDPQYYSDRKLISHAVSLFFDEQSWLGDFARLPESAELSSFFEDADQGYYLDGNSRPDIFEMMISLTALKGMKRLLRSLNILHEISTSQQIRKLASRVERQLLSEDEGQRMNDIYQFTLNEFHRPITIDEVANLAHMTRNSFCRYFKKRTRKTYIGFLNEVRIDRARKMLRQEDFSIAYVSAACGFVNLSNFNRKFKELTGTTPSSYQKKRISVN